MAMLQQSTAAGLHKEEEEAEVQETKSAAELKAQLFRSLEARGVLSQLKSQLRCRLVQELKGSRVGGASATSPLPLGLQVANGVVAEHLRVCGYQYTLSTFLPESHTDLDRLLSREDILHYLHLQPPVPLHSALSTDSGKGFLRDLLDSLSTVSVGVARCDHTHSIGVQTDEAGRGGVATLAERLRALDQLHKAQLARGDDGEERERWKCELEQQLRNQMEREMERFREEELAKAREEERAQCEAELRNLQIEQEDAHRKKMESLRRLELDGASSLRKRQLEAEAGLFARRQELELQLQSVGQREQQLARETEARQQALLLAEQRLVMAAEQLGAREREVAQYRETMESAVRGELSGWEARLKAEQAQQDSTRAELDRARLAVREEREKRERVEADLHEVSKQLVELQSQREESLRALEKMSDYGGLKQQLAEVKAQLARTERRLSENRTEHRRMQAEHQEMIRGLRRQLGRPGGEQARAVEEIERVRQEFQQQLSEAEEEKKRLRQEVQRQAAMVARQRGQLEEQALGLREMEREVADLTSQLAHWQAALLQPRHRSVWPGNGPHTHVHFKPRHTSIDPGLRDTVGCGLLPLEQQASSQAHTLHTFTSSQAHTLPTFTSSLAHTLPTFASSLAHTLPTFTSSQAHTVPTFASSQAHTLPTFTCSLAHTLPTFTSSQAHTLPTFASSLTHILPTLTSSPAHTLSTSGIITWPVGVANSTTVTSSTTTLKTTPPLQVTSSFDLPMTTPTISHTLPVTTPTETVKATPTISTGLSLDQLWRQSQSKKTELSTSTRVTSPSSPLHTLTTTHSTTVPSTPQVSTPPISTPLPSALSTAALSTTTLTLPTTTTPVPSVCVALTAGERDSVAATLAETEQRGGREHEEEVVDPLMLKYMELVKQRRETASAGRGASKDLSLSDHSQVLVNETHSLSLATDSLGGVSEGEKSSDPFQDW